MLLVTRNQKIYFAAVGLLALWVGIWGYFIPGRVDQAIPWLVPPLHARFLGAMYLSAAAFTFAGILSRYYSEVKIMIRVIAIWTGMLLVISLFYLGEFDFSHKPVWFWFGAYIMYPVIALWLMWHNRNQHEQMDGPALPNWVNKYLLAQGLVVTVLALTLLLIPGMMVNVWPWKITRLLAQIYSAPFFAYGLSSLMLSSMKIWHEVRVMVSGAFIFAFGVLLASLIHRGLFSATNISTWIWFGGFLAASVILGVMTVQSIQTGSVAA
jgi:hypothetical protein